MKQLFFFLLFAVSSFLAQAQCDEAEFKQLIAEAEKAETQPANRKPAEVEEFEESLM